MTLPALAPDPSSTRVPPAAGADDAPFPKIIYIMGTGRSGTTILEILLANNPGMTGVGEVKYIFRDGFQRDQPCACGRSGRQCELWSSVLSRTGWTSADWSKLDATIGDLESHAHFPSTFLGAFSAKKRELYREANRQLFESVAVARQCRVVVDSSKHAGRALLLARLFPRSVKVLCITRSADGIIAAFQKKNDREQRPKPPLAVAAYYIYVLFCMRLVRWRLKERAFAIRFEELNRDPAAVVRRIEEWSGFSFPATLAKLAADEAFEVGHIVTGNRIRKKGRVKFEPSAAKAQPPKGVGTRMLAAGMELYRRLLGF